MDNKKSEKKNNLPKEMTSKQKTFLFGAVAAFSIIVNVGISVIQIVRAHKK